MLESFFHIYNEARKQKVCALMNLSSNIGCLPLAMNEQITKIDWAAYGML